MSTGARFCDFLSAVLFVGMLACGCGSDSTGGGNGEPKDGTVVDGGADVTALDGAVDAADGEVGPACEVRVDGSCRCNCDGYTAEGYSCTYDPTESDNIDTDDSHNNGICPGQTQDSTGVCQKPSGFAKPQSDSEKTLGTCDGPLSSSYSDDDCDGAVDEQCACVYDPSETNDADTDGDNDYGVCQNQSRDASGVCQQPADYEAPEQASCNDGLDNDCDGSTDESTDSLGPGDSCTNDCECTTGPCVSGTCPQRIFTTSKAYDGDLGGLSGGDTKCNDVASSAGLGGTWKAVLSTGSTTAKSRLSIYAPVVRVDGGKVADGKSDLWDGSIDAAIKFDENLNATNPNNSWTGTRASGSNSGHRCQDWTTNVSTDDGTYGHEYDTDGGWVNNQIHDCDMTQALYCIDGQ